MSFIFYSRNLIIGLLLPMVVIFALAILSTMIPASSLLNFNLLSDAHAACPNPPCIAPKATTLMLYPIGGTLNTKVAMCSNTEVDGKLTYSSTGRAVSKETVTFSSDNGGGVPPARVTNTDGTYWALFKTPCSIGSGWRLQAHYAGDPDSKILRSDSAIQTYTTVKKYTLLSMAMTSNGVSTLNIPSGNTITLSGKLIDTSASSVGVGSKTITFTSSNGPYPASVTTASDGTYRATFAASNTIFSGWNIRAYFNGDSLYDTAASPVVYYNTVKQ
jgi:hypothetical protein